MVIRQARVHHAVLLNWERRRTRRKLDSWMNGLIVLVLNFMHETEDRDFMFYV